MKLFDKCSAYAAQVKVNLKEGHGQDRIQDCFIFFPGGGKLKTMHPKFVQMHFCYVFTSRTNFSGGEVSKPLTLPPGYRLGNNV